MCCRFHPPSHSPPKYKFQSGTKKKMTFFVNRKEEKREERREKEEGKKGRRRERQKEGKKEKEAKKECKCIFRHF